MNIEEYIKRNKNQFDTHEPDISRIWQHVNQEMENRKNRRINYTRWIAASLLLFIMVGFLVRHEFIVQRQITSLSQINKALEKKENAYHHQVDQKWVEYNQMLGNPSPMEPLLIDQLKQLDTLYQKGLTDIKEKGYNERAVVIMLETYEKRLRIIEQLIYEKQKQVRYEDKNHQIEI